jgi:multidrug resistance efflux pump
MGWLQLALAAERMARSQRATRLLELLGHVASQPGARAAAQDWVNRTAAWLRDDAGQQGPGFGLLLFRIEDGRPHWWVAADSAWGETASPTVLAASELAAQAAIEQQDVVLPQACAAVALDQGRPVAALVLRTEAGAPLPPGAVETLRASLALAEPLLRRWHAAERPLWRHGLESLKDGAGKFTEPGHLVWKASAAGVLLALALLLLWPVPDRVTANAVIEGRARQLVTAPFEGFLGQVLVRPGDQVRRGQLLAQLDDRDLKLEQARYQSEREQAAGRLRQAMSDREAAAQALALAEVHQADAQLALVESKLLRTRLTAPIDGLVVTGDWVQQIGAPLETGKELFEIAAGGDYRVVLHVPDRDIARVRDGQDGVLRLTGQPQSVFPFRVNKVTATASVQETVNGFRVEAGWVGQPPPLSPGMQGVGKIEVGTANLLTVWTRSSIDWLRLKLWTWWW